MATKTHYEVLEISKNAELIDIKRAYRRLALKHHPDRNNGSPESTERFKEISEAYNVLSNPATRSEYDLALKFPSSVCEPAATSTSATSPDSFNPQPTSQTSSGVKDPFQQFDDLFRNDPFFHDAFQGMDDAFAKRFENSTDMRDDVHSFKDDYAGPMFFCGPPQKKIQKKKPVPWTQWLMNKLGIEVSVTSYSHEADGSVLATSYTSKPSGTYTNKKTRTYVENGRQVTVMSMEKNGNTIEDKFVGGELVERRVNGKLESIADIASAD